MDWCRACGGRLTADDRLCPWCRAPTAAAPRERAKPAGRDRLPDVAPYSLDDLDLEDDLPSFDEAPPFARPRAERPERSSAGSPRASSPDPRPASRQPVIAPQERTTASASAPPTSRGHLALAPRAEPTADRREGPWRLEDPPSTRADAEESAPGTRARFLPRAVAFAIDLLVLTVLDGVLFVVTLAAVGVAAWLRGAAPSAPDDLVEAIFTAGQIGLFLGYFGVLHAGPGQTLGKALLGLRVIGSDGRDLAVPQGLLRAGAYVLSALPLGFGFLIAALPAGRALHDYLVGSQVVEVGGT
jgi:uncharacterized RDD family membrane protein YckC